MRLDSLPQSRLLNWENRHNVAKQSDSNVTRIKASDSSSASEKKSKAPKAKSSKSAKPNKGAKPIRATRSLPKPIAGIIGYFKGAWAELRQVHWPTRRATWGLTVAVLGFSAFFVVFILLLDAAFKYLFEIILK